MAKANKPFKKGKRVCVFCQGSSQSPISGEHIWPDWASRDNVLPQGGNRREYYLIDGKLVRPRTIKNYQRQGSPAGFEVRAPCKKCNETWMSALEDEAKPVLRALATSSMPTLDPQAIQIVAQWLFLKFLVLDTQTLPMTAATPDQYRAFMEGRTIPDEFTVWIGRIQGSHWRQCHRRFSTTALNSPSDPSDGRQNLNTLAIGFADVFFFAFFNNTDVYDPAFKTDVLARIWPGVAPSVDLPPTHISDERLDHIAAWLPAMADLHATWVP